MMATYQPQPAAMHPGMAPHGHPPMTPGGQPMNPAQMQQMGHPGASGPGQPHVSQAGAMMAMQQPGAPGGMGGQPPGAQMGGMPGQMGGQSMAGGVPNAHAMNHLNPNAQLQQQQQQHQLMQQQQQHLRQQQLMQQRLMAAQMQHQQGGGGMHGMQPGMQHGMQGMNQQQMQQMQQNNPGMHPGQIQLPPHLQQAMIRQQQAHQNQQMQHQQQQQLAMQHANSQNSNQGGQQGPPNQQGQQAQHPGQMRPQSRMANPNEQNQASAQQNAQQGPQGPQQGQQNQQGGQQPNPPQQGQQQQMTQQQQMQQMQQHRRFMHAQRQQQMAAGQTLTGQAILFFLNLCDDLCKFDISNGKNIDLWRTFAERHFAPEAELNHKFVIGTGSKLFRVMQPSIARYFQCYFDSGAQSIRLHTETISENRQPPLNRLQIHSEQATISVKYENGARLEMKGTLTADFTSPIPEKIQQLEFFTQSSEEVIRRQKIEELLDNPSPTMPNKQSPKMTKKPLPKAQQKLQNQFGGLTKDSLPKAPTGSYGGYGGPARLHTFLELGETFNLMSDLMAFAQEKHLQPNAAMDGLVAQYQTPKDAPPGQDPNQPHLNLPPNGIPMGNRTPSMQHMQMPNNPGGNPQFSSPNVSNLNLPMQNGMPGGSPHIPNANNPGLQPGGPGMMNSHTPSPHQGHMQAPQMMPQHSQQGTSSSAASANTSPNVNNKRRRSAVKMEGDEGGGGEGGGGGGGGGGKQARPSSTPRMGKKAKP